MKFRACFWMVMCCIGASYGQGIDNIYASFDGDRVAVTYNLLYSDPNQKFNVSFYSSHDNYTKPIGRMSGDAGENILPGRAKRAVWSVKEELPVNFDGEVKIKIKATRMAAPKLKMEPLALKTYKKGRTVSMQWTGGFPADKITIELFKNNVAALRVVEQTTNSGSYDWKMPKSVKGKNYTLMLTNASQAGEQVESTAFTVKPRTPFILKILPVLAIGGVIYFLSGDDGGPDDNTTGTPPLDVLPSPVKPGG